MLKFLVLSTGNSVVSIEDLESPEDNLLRCILLFLELQRNHEDLQMSIVEFPLKETRKFLLVI